MSLVEGHRQVTDRHVRTQLLRADRRARRHRRPARDTGWPVGWHLIGYTEQDWAFKLPSGQVALMNPPSLPTVRYRSEGRAWVDAVMTRAGFPPVPEPPLTHGPSPRLILDEIG